MYAELVKERPEPKDPANPSPLYGKTYPSDHLQRREVIAMLEVLNGGSALELRNRALIGLLWTTGLRISEALDLMPYDVDHDRQTVRVLRGKGGKARTASIAKFGLELLAPWEEKRATWCRDPVDAPLFCNRAGRPMQTSYVRTMLPAVARKAGVQRRVHAHIFRHTFAVELAQRGVPAPYIQRLLGHSSLGTTTAYLESLSPEAALSAVRGLEW